MSKRPAQTRLDQLWACGRATNLLPRITVGRDFAANVGITSGIASHSCIGVGDEHAERLAPAYTLSIHMLWYQFCALVGAQFAHLPTIAIVLADGHRGSHGIDLTLLSRGYIELIPSVGSKTFTCEYQHHTDHSKC